MALQDELFREKALADKRKEMADLFGDDEVSLIIIMEGGEQPGGIRSELLFGFLRHLCYRRIGRRRGRKTYIDEEEAETEVALGTQKPIVDVGTPQVFTWKDPRLNQSEGEQGAVRQSEIV